MDSNVVPIVTVCISVGGAVLSLWRAARAERRADDTNERAASQSSLNALMLLNKAQAQEIISFGRRLDHLEEKLADCMHERDALLVEVERLRHA